MEIRVIRCNNCGETLVDFGTREDNEFLRITLIGHSKEFLNKDKETLDTIVSYGDYCLKCAEKLLQTAINLCKKK